MVRMLLFDRHFSHAVALLRALKNSGYEATLCRDTTSLSHELATSTYEVVIVSSNEMGDWKEPVVHIQRTTCVGICQPAIICYAHSYNGPQERLDAEKKGVRLIYEHRQQ